MSKFSRRLPWQRASIGHSRLGNINGDGCVELALCYARADRSRHDEHLHDTRYGARSYIAVVSGAEAVRAMRVNHSPR